MSSSGTTQWRNVYIVGLLSIFDKLQFGYFFWSLWPYLRQLDSAVSPSFVGICFALTGFGEVVSSPLLGWYSDRSNGVLKGLLFSYGISLFGNVLYLFAKILPEIVRLPAALFARFIVGAGTANRAICFSYTAAISTMEDRSRVVSIVNGAMAIGMTMGPGVQAAVNFMKVSKLDFFGLVIDVNNVNIIMGILTNLLCIVLVSVFLNDSQGEIKKKNNKDMEQGGVKPLDISLDKIAIGICILSRINRFFINANFKSIGLLYSEVMFNYTQLQALIVNSNISVVTSILVVILFFICGFTNFTKKLNNRIVTIVCLSLTLVYHILTMPWPFIQGRLPYCERNSSSDAKPSWCDSIPPISEYVYFGGYVLINGLVLPLSGNSTKIILSKLLGKRKQGKIQGLAQSIGSTAKVLGPILLSFLFTHFGPQSNWILEILFLVVLVGLWVATYKRMKTPS
ncbi:hypothetical protein L596_019683 [Steinernema carpocapsae]|uniref:Major facilitator superfamily (MFS) profile domain-containing protein n=1 Tax=Steinernema carpocapsae TaxID=34508 RepID=A0A4U5MS40_STECR|nr:hypothetical protein L596_019683 [Steinernema carpocapsae]